MKKISIVLLISCLPIYIYSTIKQQRIIDYAFKQATNYSDYSSKMTFSIDDQITEKHLKKWILINGTNLVLKDNMIKIYKHDGVWKFGANHTFIKEVYFVESNKYSSYLSYYTTKKEQARLAADRAGAVALAGLLGLGKLVYDGIKNTDFSIGSTSKSSTSSKDYEIISSENAGEKEKNRTVAGVQLVEFEDIKRIKWSDNSYEPEGYTFEIYIDGDKKWDDKTIKRDKDNNNWYGDNFGSWKICDSKYDREYALKQYFVKRYGDGKDAKEYKFKYR